MHSITVILYVFVFSDGEIADVMGIFTQCTYMVSCTSILYLTTFVIHVMLYLHMYVSYLPLSRSSPCFLSPPPSPPLSPPLPPSPPRLLREPTRQIRMRAMRECVLQSGTTVPTPYPVWVRLQPLLKYSTQLHVQCSLVYSSADRVPD